MDWNGGYMWILVNLPLVSTFMLVAQRIGNCCSFWVSAKWVAPPATPVPDNRKMIRELSSKMKRRPCFFEMLPSTGSTYSNMSWAHEQLPKGIWKLENRLYSFQLVCPSSRAYSSTLNGQRHWNLKAPNNSPNNCRMFFAWRRWSWSSNHLGTPCPPADRPALPWQQTSPQGTENRKLKGGLTVLILQPTCRWVDFREKSTAMFRQVVFPIKYMGDSTKNI